MTMDYYQQQLDAIDQKDLKRQLHAIRSLENGYCQYDGKRLLNLSSNDYLGLNHHKTLRQEFKDYLSAHPECWQMGAASSRLLTGNTDLYTETEELLKLNYNSEAALFFNSGYHANAGILPALSNKKDLIVADKLCHASLIDGMRLSAADVVRYRHLDYTQLKSILEKKRCLYRQVFIVTESVFSMDGDEADLCALAQIKEQYDAILYVDEAHSVGVKGVKGLGSAEEQGVVDRVDILVGTMGKAYASLGAFAIFNHTLQQLMISKARTLLFSTALPSINMVWNKLVVSRMPNFIAERKQLDNLTAFLKSKLTTISCHVDCNHIMPLMIGSNSAAIQLSEQLIENGFLIFAIRPPTVPENTARLRISITANMQKEALSEMVDCLHHLTKHE